MGRSHTEALTSSGRDVPGVAPRTRTLVVAALPSAAECRLTRGISGCDCHRVPPRATVSRHMWLQEGCKTMNASPSSTRTSAIGAAEWPCRIAAGFQRAAIAQPSRGLSMDIGGTSKAPPCVARQASAGGYRETHVDLCVRRGWRGTTSGTGPGIGSAWRRVRRLWGQAPTAAGVDFQRLGDTTYSIKGYVLDYAGNPVAGADVGWGWRSSIFDFHYGSTSFESHRQQRLLLAEWRHRRT